jgi:hypothetical protein
MLVFNICDPAPPVIPSAVVIVYAHGASHGTPDNPTILRSPEGRKRVARTSGFEVRGSSGDARSVPKALSSRSRERVGAPAAGWGSFLWRQNAACASLLPEREYYEERMTYGKHNS